MNGLDGDLTGASTIKYHELDRPVGQDMNLDLHLGRVHGHSGEVEADVGGGGGGGGGGDVGDGEHSEVDGNMDGDLGHGASEDYSGSPDDFLDEMDLHLGTDFAKSFLHDAESTVQPILSLPVIQTDFDTGLPFGQSTHVVHRHNSTSSEDNLQSNNTQQTHASPASMDPMNASTRTATTTTTNANACFPPSQTHTQQPQDPMMLHSQHQQQLHPHHHQIPMNFEQELESKVLHGMTVAEATRLIQVWDFEVNCLYPLFPVGELQRRFGDMCKFYSAHGVFRAEDEYDLLNVKITIAIGSVTAASHTTAGKLLYEEMLSKVERNLISGRASLGSLVTLLLMHQYQFHKDMGTIAYRTVGLAGILALELGLYSAHETDRLYKEANDREYARIVFWCLYVMDRRLAIYAKRPFILHDEAIDQKLPQFDVITSSEDDLFRAMHLNYMIHYSRLSGKVLEALGPQRNVKGFQDNVQYLIFLMEKWQSSLPPELKLRDNLPSQPSPDSSRKLKWIIFLKSNLILLHIYQSCTQETYIQPAINTSCECIRELGRLYFNTDFYASCEIQYNHFLVAALDVLYSSLRRAPQYLAKCTPEIKLALKIISLIMKRSHNDKRNGTIWQLVVSFAFKFGLSSPLGAKLLQSHEPDIPTSAVPMQHDYLDRELLLTSLISDIPEQTSA